MQLQPSNFSHLRWNICEIYYSLYMPKKVDNTLNLVALPHMRLCSPDTLMGKGKILYQQTKVRILNLFSFQNELPKSTEEALKFTFDTLFENAVHAVYAYRLLRILHCIESIEISCNKIDLSINEDSRELRFHQDITLELPNANEEDIKRYRETFKDKRLLNEDELLIIENANIDFFQSTYSLWRAIVSQKGDVEERKRILQPILDHLSPDSLLLNRDYYKALKAEGKWTNFIRLTRQPIPIAQLAKLSHPDELSMDEKEQLKKWVEAINGCESLTVSLLTAILKEAIRVIDIEGSSSVTFQDILFWLYQEGCQLLNEEDDTHMAKRNALAPGSSLVCNGKTVILGNKLGEDKNTVDPFLCFELRDYPDYVIRIAKNCLLTLTEELMGQQEHWGIRLAKIILNIEDNPDLSPVSGIDAKGRFIIVEKLNMNVLKKEWMSDHPILHTSDEELVLILASHFKWMLKGNFYANYADKYLGRDASGLLKATRPIKREEADYNKWEWAALQKSKGNIYVLNSLMELSDWAAYPIANFYREEVARTLHAGWISERIYFIPDGYDKGCYYKHADALCQDALDQFKECQTLVKTLLKLHNNQGKIELMNNEVVKRMIHFYNAWPVPGFLPPYLVQAVVDSFKNDFKGPSNAHWGDYTERMRHFYPELFESMPLQEIRKIIESFNNVPEFCNFYDYENYYNKQRKLLEKYNRFFASKLE